MLTCSRIHALMLREQVRHTGDAGTLRKFIHRSIAFAKRDGLLFVGESGQEFAVTPDAAEIDGCVRKPAVPPESFQAFGIRLGFLPTRISDF